MQGNPPNRSPAPPEREGPAAGLLHPSLQTGAGGAALAAARLTDRQKLGAVLQASALLAHLEHASWHLPAGWERAAVMPDGLLLAGAARPGAPRQPAQEALRALLGELFGGEVAGRGEARRSARALVELWRQSLAPLPGDDAVAQVLRAAPFLWEPAFAVARRALAAVHYRPAGPHLWVAGPGAFRARLLGRCRDLAGLAALLAGEAARACWEGDGPPSSPGERLELARTLFALGRFERALATVGAARSAAALALRLRCQYQLGNLGAARATLRRLAEASLGTGELLEVAETALRVLANRGEPAEAAAWVERALAGAPGALGYRAQLLAANAAWDRGDPAGMGRHLEAARPALGSPAFAWRWHQTRGLQAMGAGDGAGVVESLTRALGSGRRQLLRHEAAGLWNDLGIGRAQVSDLGGAERAFLHALRLFGRCDGPRRTTLALHNLAEVRLRRGHLAGVRDILERSTAENRLAGNLRGLTQDHELWARCELAEGRFAAALALCRGALAALDAHGLDWRRSELHLFAARALGWLERRQEAAAELAAADPAALAELEPEERPALLVHAGDREGALRALRAAADSPGRGLWLAVLDGQAPPAAAWSALADLEPYRAARLVFDLELAAPASVPRSWRRTAIATLRRVGAPLLAERLEAGDEGPWQALAAYLAKPLGEPAACAALLAGAGYAGVELSWSGESGRRVLVAGEGGGQEMAADAAGGRLALAAPALDAPLKALFALVHRDLAGRLPADGLTPEEPARPVRAGGMIGESPALRAALERLRTLAAGELTILILGESGTGKELVAREVHRASPRARRPFVVVNCAALSETLLLSDLFGHVRGAFTGADRDRAGVFETADGGTVFLDEIGDLPATAQGMLLRVLQEGEVRRVGESVARRVDVRTIAATHRDLASMVAERSFRQDLFYRLKVGNIELPPLRDRGRDVLLLAEHFLSGSASRPRLSPPAQARLLAYRWPGNVRELKNVIAVAAALAGNGIIEPAHLGLTAAAPGRDDDRSVGYHQQVNAFRRQLVQEAITACGGSRAEAARRLGLSRQTLSYLVRQLGLL